MYQGSPSPTPQSQLLDIYQQYHYLHAKVLDLTAVSSQEQCELEKWLPNGQFL